MKSIEIHQNIALRLLTHIFLSIIDLFRYFLMRFWSVFCWINQSFLWSHCTISHYSFFDCLDGNKLISKGVLLQPVVFSDLLYHWEFLKVDRKGSNLHIDFIKNSLMKSLHFFKISSEGFDTLLQWTRIVLIFPAITNFKNIFVI